jgi:hypothetical protein
MLGLGGFVLLILSSAFGELVGEDGSMSLRSPRRSGSIGTP